MKDAVEEKIKHACVSTKYTGKIHTGVKTKGKEVLGQAASRGCGWSRRERLDGMSTGREKNFSPQQIVIPEEFGTQQSKQISD